MNAQDCMTTKVECCHKDTDLVTVAKRMKDNHVGVIPIVEENGQRKLVGLVTDRDIVLRLVSEGVDPAKAKAKDCMSSQIVSVRLDTSIEECCRLMDEKKIRRLPVVNEKGNLEGMIALADIAHHGSEHLCNKVVKGVSEPSQSERRV